MGKSEPVGDEDISIHELPAEVILAAFNRNQDKEGCHWLFAAICWPKFHPPDPSEE